MKHAGYLLLTMIGISILLFTAKEEGLVSGLLALLGYLLSILLFLLCPFAKLYFLTLVGMALGAVFALNGMFRLHPLYYLFTNFLLLPSLLIGVAIFDPGFREEPDPQSLVGERIKISFSELYHKLREEAISNIKK